MTAFTARPTYKLKMRSTFPASVTATTPITVTKTGGTYNFGLDPDGIEAAGGDFTVGGDLSVEGGLEVAGTTQMTGNVGIAGGSNAIPLDVNGRIHATWATFSNGSVFAGQPLQIDFIPGTSSGGAIANISIGSPGTPYAPPSDLTLDGIRAFNYIASPYVADANVSFTGIFFSNQLIAGTNGTVNGAIFEAITGGTWTNPLTTGGAVGLYAIATANAGRGDNYAANFITTVPQSVTATRSVHGLEIDINNGSSTAVKLGLVTNLGTGANDGGAVTGTYTLTNGGGTVASSFGWMMQAASTSVGVVTGIGLIGQGSGAWPLAATATGLLMAGGTAAIGIDLSRNTTWTTAAIKTPGYTVDGSGNVTSQSIATAAATTQTGANYTVLATDSAVIANRAGTVTLTLPAAATYPGRWLTVKTIQAQTVVSATSNVVPLIGGAAGTAILAATAGKWAQLQSNGTNWEIMASN